MKTSLFLFFTLAIGFGFEGQAQELQTYQIELPVLEATFGQSTGPADFGDRQGPSRKVGGESFSIQLKDGIEIESVEVQAFSNSNEAWLKIYEANLIQKKDGKLEKTGLVNLIGSLKPLESFTANIQGEVKKLELQIEAFADDDASLSIKLRSKQKLGENDFVIVRDNSSSEARYGKYFDETNYKNFRMEDMARLSEVAQNMTQSELLASSWVCSSYSRDLNANKTRVSADFKTRRYFLDKNGLLQSQSDLKNDPTSWVQTEGGWVTETGSDIWNGVNVPSYFLVRKSPAGNLVTELIGHRDDMIAALGKNWVKYVESQSVYRSRYRPGRAIVTAREFCRPAKL